MCLHELFERKLALADRVFALWAVIVYDLEPKVDISAFIVNYSEMFDPFWVQIVVNDLGLVMEDPI